MVLFLVFCGTSVTLFGRIGELFTVCLPDGSPLLRMTTLTKRNKSLNLSAPGCLRWGGPLIFTFNVNE